MARWLVVLAACGLSLAAVATAQECPEIVAVLPYGEPDVVAVEGPHAYLGIGRGLLVVDESDPADIRSVARLAMPGTVRGIAVAGDRTYVTLGEEGVRVVDASDPTDPRIVQAVDTPGEAQGVKVSGGLVFVAAGTAGLCAVSPTVDPPLLGCVDTLQDARDVDVNGILALVADGPAGLVVVDVSDPAHMAVVGSASMEARAVEAQGDLAFVACGDGYLRVVDVGQPASPGLVGELAVPGAADLDVNGDLVVVAALDSYPSSAGLRVVDVSAPSAPVQIGSLTVHGVEGRAQVVLHGDRATLGGHDGVTLVDLSAPSIPVELAHLPTGVYDTVEAHGRLAILSKWWGDNPSLVDLSQPDRPVELLVLPRRYAWLAALSGPWLYLATSVGTSPIRYEVQVFDLSDPLHPALVAAHELPMNGELMTRSGHMLHVMDGLADIHMLDVSTPWLPVEMGVVEGFGGWPGGPRTDDIAAVPGFLFRGGENVSYPPAPWCFGWYQVVDVTDPTHPTSTYLPPLEPPIPWTLHVEENLLVAVGRYDCNGPYEVALYDLSEPTSPMRMSGGEIDGWLGSVAISHHGQVLSLSEPSDRVVRAIDLRAPWDPAGIAEIPLPAPGGLATLGHHLLVADEELGLVVLDTTCVGGLFADGFESGGTGSWSNAWP